MKRHTIIILPFLKHKGFYKGYDISLLDLWGQLMGVIVVTMAAFDNIVLYVTCYS